MSIFLCPVASGAIFEEVMAGIWQPVTELVAHSFVIPHNLVDKIITHLLCCFVDRGLVQSYMAEEKQELLDLEALFNRYFPMDLSLEYGIGIIILRILFYIILYISFFIIFLK